MERMLDSNDSDLLEKSRNGDLDAFGELVRRHHGRIAALCAGLLQDRSELDDAVQEIFVKAYRSHADFKGDSQFSTWLYRIAMNHCLDMRRKSSRSRNVSLDSLIAERGEPEEEREDRPDHAKADREARLARRLLAELPEGYREALVLRIQGMSYEQIASTLGCSLDAVKARLRRARRLLAEHMGRSSSEDGRGTEEKGVTYEA